MQQGQRNILLRSGMLVMCSRHCSCLLLIMPRPCLPSPLVPAQTYSPPLPHPLPPPIHQSRWPPPLNPPPPPPLPLPTDAVLRAVERLQPHLGVAVSSIAPHLPVPSTTGFSRRCAPPPTLPPPLESPASCCVTPVVWPRILRPASSPFGQLCYSGRRSRWRRRRGGSCR